MAIRELSKMIAEVRITSDRRIAERTRLATLRNITGRRGRPQMVSTQLTIGAINRKMIAGHSRESEIRLEMIRETAGGLRMTGMRRQIANKGRLEEIRTLARIRLRPDSIRVIARNITGGRRSETMRSRSAEVLLFLNFEHLTTPWARGHRG